MPRSYTVVSGDTLGTLAARFFGDSTRGALIATASSINPGDTLTVGESLVIPDVDLTPLPVTNGKPRVGFVGALPYASEVFGVYQPLAGWFGQRNSGLLGDSPAAAPTAFSDQKSVAARGQSHSDLLRGVLGSATEGAKGVLSPVGLVNLFREYFFEFDTFLGTPVGHLWISPGGSVEVIESSTRRTLTERTSETSQSATRKSEETLTSQDDVADAVKEDNANDTKLGASASAGANFAGVYHGDASASFSVDSTTKKSSEDTHKHTRMQSSKVTSEITRNFKTTFKTTTEATDTTSRRYIVQNTGATLVNYELRRKMRKVGVQVQHIATRLSWQVFVGDPGKDLGLGEMVHVIPAPDLSSIKKPDPLPALVQKVVPFLAIFPIMKFPGTENDPHINMNFVFHSHNSPEMLDYGTEFEIMASAEFQVSSPAPGYTLTGVSVVSSKSGGKDVAFVPQQPIDVSDANTGRFVLYADRLNTGDLSPLQLELDLVWNPPAVDPAKAQFDSDMAAYDALVSEAQRTAYAEGVRSRLELASNLVPRPSEDLRREEREWVYAQLVRELRLVADAHLESELVRQIFDVDEMLYFVAPDYWRPFVNPVAKPIARDSVGRYPVPPLLTPKQIAADYPLAGDVVTSMYSHTSVENAIDADGNVSPEWRVNYLISAATRPAPLGSSLGWLIQIDGDERRNEFLNAAWVKAVLPIRAGHETEGLDWLGQAKVEGEDGLSLPYPFQPGDPPEYQGKLVGDVLAMLATALQAANTEIGNTLAAEHVFETGYDPLAGGFRPALPYTVFDEWVEVLPTDQVVAVEVAYDPRTGAEL